MIYHSILLRHLLLSCLALTVLSVANPELTFKDVDPVSGKAVICEQCPPGKFLRQRCTSSSPSVCEECPPGSFTELWNYIGRCLRCGVCGRNMVEKSQCSVDSDCQCECKPGYYFKEQAGMCVRHTECGTGYGVRTRGNPNLNTVCAPCSNRTFSDKVSSELSCTPHTVCENQGLKVVLKGSTWHNTVCFSCEEARNKDAADYLRDILPSFFSHHNLALRRLRQVVSKLPKADGTTRGRHGLSDLYQSELLALLEEWIKTSSADLLRKLPLVLTETGATYSAERLENKLKRIESTMSQLCGPGNEI